MNEITVKKIHTLCKEHDIWVEIITDNKYNTPAFSWADIEPEYSIEEKRWRVIAFFKNHLIFFYLDNLSFASLITLDKETKRAFPNYFYDLKEVIKDEIE